MAEAGGLVLTRQGISGRLAAFTRLDSRRFVADLAVSWALIVAAAVLAVGSGHWLAGVAAVLVIATRQHALGSLMHDRTHFRAFASRPLTKDPRYAQGAVIDRGYLGFGPGRLLGQIVRSGAGAAPCQGSDLE